MEIKSSPDKLASLLLRVGLAAVFLYAAVSSLMQPSEWVGYLPSFLAKMVAADTLLKVFALYEIGLAVWLLSNWRVRYTGTLCALSLVGIMAAQPSIFIVTFRDIGLFFMAVAVAVLDIEQPKH